jgi:hypothetical protein
MGIIPVCDNVSVRYDLEAKEAVVPGATVTLNNQATGFSRSVKTDDQGSYPFFEVPPATYVMTVTATGFATAKRESEPRPAGAGRLRDCRCNR